MIKKITERKFRLNEIPKEEWKYFRPLDTPELSEMQTFLLTLIGDALRKSNAVTFWNSGHYSWWYDYPKEYRTEEYRVFMTKNFSVMFEDCEHDKLYRVCLR